MLLYQGWFTLFATGAIWNIYTVIFSELFGIGATKYMIDTWDIYEIFFQQCLRLVPTKIINGTRVGATMLVIELLCFFGHIPNHVLHMCAFEPCSKFGVAFVAKSSQVRDRELSPRNVHPEMGSHTNVREDRGIGIEQTFLRIKLTAIKGSHVVCKCSACQWWCWPGFPNHHSRNHRGTSLTPKLLGSKQ